MRQTIIIATLLGAASVATAHSVDVTPQNLAAVQAQCNGGDGNVCQTMGGVLRDREKAQPAGVRLDLDLSLRFYERGCELGDIGACGSINRIYANPRFRDYDPARALPFFEERCERRGADSSDCRVVKRLRDDL